MVKSKPSMTGKMSGGAPRPESFDDFINKYSYTVAGGEYLDVPRYFREYAEKEGLNGRTEYQLYMDDNDDYGTAEVVSQSELDAMIADGMTEVFRGMPDRDTTGKEKIENLMYGKKYYVGQGIFGDGMYFASNILVSGYYATEWGGTTGAVARAAIRKDAKIGDYFDVVREMDNEGYTGFIHSDAAISAYARSRGYDILTSNHQSQGTYYTVLNRGALVFSNDIGVATADGIRFKD